MLFCLQEMVDWFNAIRAARFHYLQVAFPGAGDEEVRAADSVTQHAVVELVAEWFISNPRMDLQKCHSSDNLCVTCASIY